MQAGNSPHLPSSPARPVDGRRPFEWGGGLFSFELELAGRDLRSMGCLLARHISTTRARSSKMISGVALPRRNSRFTSSSGR